MTLEGAPAPSPLEEAKKLILTPEEYVLHPFSQGNGEDSYVVKITANGKHLTYFGSTHTNNPDHPVFKEIEDAFREASPDFVYVEGMEHINGDPSRARERVARMSLTEAKMRGESTFALKLAVDAGIPFESPEPRHRTEIEHLVRSGFSRIDVFNFYMYRVIAQYQRQHEVRSPEDCTKYLMPFLKWFETESQWPAEELEVFERALLGSLDTNDESYTTLVDPMPWMERPRHVTNEIAASSSQFRNEFALERIAAGLKEHNRLFAVYGSGHAVELEPALRAVVGG